MHRIVLALILMAAATVAQAEILPSAPLSTPSPLPQGQRAQSLEAVTPSPSSKGDFLGKPNPAPRTSVPQIPFPKKPPNPPKNPDPTLNR